MNNKSERQLTICHQRGSENNSALIIQGQWFKKLGFKIGDYVQVKINDGNIIINKLNPNQLEEITEYVLVKQVKKTRRLKV